MVLYAILIYFYRHSVIERLHYKSTMHPVFLPLNLTEVYALTIYLNRVINRHDPNAMIIQQISERIKSQLSDYAIERLFPENIEDRIENQYLNDEDLACQRKGIYAYLMKSGQYCNFIWRGVEYRGSIKYVDEMYKVCLENGEFIDAELEDIDFIIDTLEYK